MLAKHVKLNSLNSGASFPFGQTAVYDSFSDLLTCVITFPDLQ